MSETVDINLRDQTMLASLRSAANFEMGQEGHPVVKQAWANLATSLSQVSSGLRKIDRHKADFEAKQAARVASRAGSKPTPDADKPKRRRGGLIGKKDDTGLSAVSDDPPTDSDD